MAEGSSETEIESVGSILMFTQQLTSRADEHRVLTDRRAVFAAPADGSRPTHDQHPILTPGGT